MRNLVGWLWARKKLILAVIAVIVLFWTGIVGKVWDWSATQVKSFSGQQQVQLQPPPPPTPAASTPAPSKDVEKKDAVKAAESKAPAKAAADPAPAKKSVGDAPKSSPQAKTPAPKPVVQQSQTAQKPPAKAPYRWHTVGADPCNPKAGCTLAWGLAQTGWPQAVQSALMDSVRNVRPETTHLKSGWQGWMTWGWTVPKFEMNTVATWEPQKVASAALWKVQHEGIQYHLVQVEECKNWGGWTSVALEKREERKPSIIGTLPRFNCPE